MVTSRKRGLVLYDSDEGQGLSKGEHECIKKYKQTKMTLCKSDMLACALKTLCQNTHARRIDFLGCMHCIQRETVGVPKGIICLTYPMGIEWLCLYVYSLTERGSKVRRQDAGRRAALNQPSTFARKWIFFTSLVF